MPHRAAKKHSYAKDLEKAMRLSAAEARAEAIESERVAMAIANSIDDEVMAENFQRALNIVVKATDKRVERYYYPLPDEPGYHYNPVPPREETVTADGVLRDAKFLLAPFHRKTALLNLPYKLTPLSAMDNSEFSFDKAVDGTFVYLNLRLKHESLVLLLSKCVFVGGASRRFQLFQLPQLYHHPLKPACMYNQWDGKGRRLVQFGFRVDDTACERVMVALDTVCDLIQA